MEFAFFARLELATVELAIVGSRRPRVVVLRFAMQPPILFGFFLLGLGPIDRRVAGIVTVTGVDVLPVGVEAAGLGSRLAQALFFTVAEPGMLGILASDGAGNDVLL